MINTDDVTETTNTFGKCLIPSIVFLSFCFQRNNVQLKYLMTVFVEPPNSFKGFIQKLKKGQLPSI